MTEASDSPLLLYGALWGASFGSEEVGAVTNEVRADKPFDEEWWAVEQSHVHDARRDATSGGYVPPPLCLVVGAKREDSEPIGDACNRAGHDLVGKLSRAILALRLTKAGWFLDPRQVALTFVVNDGMWHVLRRPGPYRQAMLGGVASPLPSYSLSVSDFGTETLGPVPAMAMALEAYHEVGETVPVAIALAQFNRSFGMSLSHGDRAATLFTSIDAMFGGMSARRIGRMPLKRSGFRARVKEAMVAGGQPEELAIAETDWLDWKEGGRGMRNALAHGDVGRPVSDISVDDVLRLQALVRATLPGFIGFSTRLSSDKSLFARLDLPDSVGVTAAYNRALERHDHDLVEPLGFE
jgi:hypothetical protein